MVSWRADVRRHSRSIYRTDRPRPSGIVQASPYMNDLLQLKVAVHRQCLEQLKQRIQVAEMAIEGSRDAVRNDTKSSAGDKHETARSMAQLEIEKQQSSLQHLHQMDAILQRMDPSVERKRISPGCLIQTDVAVFYISVGLGKVRTGPREIQVISKEAPIFEFLSNTPIGTVGFFNGTAYRIEAIA